jgi:hypothetical protein
VQKLINDKLSFLRSVSGDPLFQEVKMAQFELELPAGSDMATALATYITTSEVRGRSWWHRLWEKVG